MARSYQGKKTSTKLLEGATAGAIGGVVALIVLLIADLLLRAGNAWWYTASAFGSLVTGNPEGSVAQVGGSFLLGAVLLILLFALIGIGFTYYLPIFRRFKLNLLLAGAIYGAVIWLLFFFIFLNSFSATVSRLVSQPVLFVATVLGGAAMGWWMARLQR